MSTDERPANIYIDKQTPAAYRALNGLALKVGEAADAAGWTGSWSSCSICASRRSTAAPTA